MIIFLSPSALLLEFKEFELFRINLLLSYSLFELIHQGLQDFFAVWPRLLYTINEFTGLLCLLRQNFSLGIASWFMSKSSVISKSDIKIENTKIDYFWSNNQSIKTNHISEHAMQCGTSISIELTLPINIFFDIIFELSFLKLKKHRHSRKKNDFCCLTVFVVLVFCKYHLFNTNTTTGETH